MSVSPSAAARWRRQGRRIGGIAFSMVLLGSAAVGRAFPAAVDTKEPPPAPGVDSALPRELCEKPKGGPATPDKNAQKAARALLLQAKQAYDENHYADSARALRQAYEIHAQLETLFNLAQTCREGSAIRESLQLYELVLAADPDENIAAECRRHVPLLKASLAQQLDKEAQERLTAKDTARAQQLAEEAFKLDGKALYVFHVAEAQRLGGQSREAILSYERYLNMTTGEERQPAVLGHLAQLRALDDERRAEEHARAGEHTQAMAAWQAAYRSEPRPIYTYRIAESARLSGALGESVASYQRFLRDTRPPEFPKEREAAERYLPVVQRELQDQKRPVYKRWWFWTILGGVAAGIGAGVAAGVVAGRNQNALPGVPLENQRILQPVTLLRF